MKNSSRPSARPVPPFEGDGAALIDDCDWLTSFYEGDQAAIAAVYQVYFSTVRSGVERVLTHHCAADRETVIFQVFEGLLSRRKMREGFRGGRMDRWLTAVARNAAIDFLRRHQREVLTDPQLLVAAHRVEADEGPDPEMIAQQRELEAQVAEFRAQHLPPKLEPVFEARFFQQLSQYEAAEQLGMRRTTLASQEKKIRALLRRFFLRHEGYA
ncbi:sigma-70 family RNA polymerase sigma factor [Myxococcota bacterium]|nr:sigma-70 family RNA polymerase sigma factor [Myxococcota bacterium]MBU1432461.1 sigma-70 family RNA polymerase sigma factor [Myxococcota bacterium]MBU1896513.1 sigma-70 family RNA polymerase sigma factor [Myxococcota bacterium]